MSAASGSGRRVLRRILLGLGGLVALLVVVAVVALLTFNPNRFKPRIIAAVRQATGRTLTLAGPIGIKLALHPTIEAHDVALANPPGFSRPEMARLAAVDVRLSLAALLHGRIAIERLVLVRPDILLERTRAGVVNWRFARPAPAATPARTPPAGTSPAAAPAPSSGPGLFVQDLRIQDGTLGYRNDATGAETTVALRQAQLHAAGPRAPLRLDATATMNGAPVSLTGRTGSLAALEAPAPSAPPPAASPAAPSPSAASPAAAPWPVRLVLTAAGARLAADGTIADPLAGRGVALHFDLHIPDLRALGAIAGAALPPVREIALTGRLVAPGTIAQGARLQGFALTLPQGRLAGTLAVRLGAVPALSGSLTSPSLDADALLAELHQGGASGHPAAGAPPGQPATAVPSGPAAPPARPSPAAARSGHLIPDTTLPLGLLRRADADLSVSVAALRSGGETWRNLAFHLALAHGKLVLAPFTATPPAGPLSLRLTLDAAQKVPQAALSLHAPGLALASLLALAGEKGLATGDVALVADLHGAGTSLHAIAAGLDGVVAATMTGGTIDNAVLDRLFGGVLARANLAGLVAHGGTSTIRCLALRLVAQHGVAQVAPFLFASTLTTISGAGTVHLGSETLDLLLHPQGRVGGTGFSVPVRVSGGWAHPNAALSARGAAEAGIGVALSLLGGKKLGVPQAVQAPTCATALALARGQQPPAAAPAAPAPTQPPGKLPNPGTLLRNLFR
ncbi:MAG: AsmA family protein [Proteobacteria bacterium]|nr:AsmA family protein [Pseudomonadota bacterium]